jgi:hypothetical protein
MIILLGEKLPRLYFTFYVVVTKAKVIVEQSDN